MNLTYLTLGAGVLALAYSFYRTAWISKQDHGTEKMVKIGHYISSGAMAFLRAEYKILIWFVLAVAILLGLSANQQSSHALVALSFVVGALCSALAGFLGMRVATKANYRTAHAARTGLEAALKVAFTGGSVMGMGVVGLGVLGLGGLFAAYMLYFAPATGSEMDRVLNILSGFSLGASSIALFARVGGGIYTKAADVGADLVGKVEAGIPEDHPLNPATIADNVGDNVGDVAGMGADLFESYVGSILGSMVLGAAFIEVLKDVDGMNGLSAVILPLVLAGIGIVCSIIGTFFVRVKEGGDPGKALSFGHYFSSAIMIGGAAYAIYALLPATWTTTSILEGTDRVFTATGVLVATVIGLIAGVLVGGITEYYTGTDKKPVTGIVDRKSTRLNSSH